MWRRMSFDSLPSNDYSVLLFGETLWSCSFSFKVGLGQNCQNKFSKWRLLNTSMLILFEGTLLEDFLRYSWEMCGKSRRGHPHPPSIHTITAALTSLAGAVHAASGAETEQDGWVLGSWELRAKGGNRHKFTPTLYLKKGKKRIATLGFTLEVWKLLFLFAATRSVSLCKPRQVSPSPGFTPKLCIAQISSVTEAGEEPGPCKKGAHKKCHCCVLEVREKNN